MNKVCIPKLRFSGFDGEWEDLILKDVVKVNQGLAILKSNRHSVNGHNRLHYITIPYLEGKGGEYIENAQKSVICYPEDIIVTRTGNGVGKTWTNAHGVFHNNFFKVSPLTKSTSKLFLFQYLNKPEIQFLMKQYAGTSAIPDLNHGEFYIIPYYKTSLEEQQKIASFLSSVDEKVLQLSRKKELLEQYKKGVMQQLFSGKLRFKDENGNEYPDWEEKKLGEVLKIGSGKDYKHLEKGNIPVFGTGGYMLSVNKCLYKGETVFIGRKGTIDKPFYFDGEFWTVDTLFYTHSFKNTIPKFIYCVFQQINWKLHNEASGVPSLSKSTIEKLKFNLPSLPEQQKIANFLSGIDDKIENTHQEINNMQGFKKGLLQQMFV
ncbi:restriction endonuclease subunit S [Flavobacterium algicola]|uniref:restriction endonuclease subunit S n=1 Tax=Flavobacterium algicola TaxID=556529 RepID=UPI001EFD0E26|nr:restriction endonuclease subunit S [Flavobacterium algicola]MCG9792464.1 restriction endonuclease subunit S [Flavobacterium algicola]